MRCNQKYLKASILWLTAVMNLGGNALVFGQNSQPEIQVFILAGQSNMEGQGVVDLDHPQYYNGGKGTLLRVSEDPKNKERMRHIRTEEGEWVQRDDVWCRFVTQHEIKKGPLSIGFAGYPGKHHIGPEFQFGHVVGAAFDEPVLLIKTAWGGKSLFKDFRPPSAVGEIGPYYQQMLDEVQQGLQQLGTDFPELQGFKPRIAGFVWFQGWNDAFGPEEAREEYESNLVHLIQDVRKALDRPDLPVVVGELGNGGEKAGANLLAIRQAQRDAVSKLAKEQPTAFVSTTSFARPAEDSPNTTHGHHWFGNAESYFLIGDALGQAMVKLVKDPRAVDGHSDSPAQTR